MCVWDNGTCDSLTEHGLSPAFRPGKNVVQPSFLSANILLPQAVERRSGRTAAVNTFFSILC